MKNRFSRKVVPYIIAVLSSLLIFALKISFPSIGIETPYLLVLFAVIVSAMAGGMGPGIAATAITVIGTNVIFIRNDAGPINAATIMIPFIAYSLNGLIVSWLLHRFRLSNIKNEQMASIIESASDAVVGESLDGIVTAWNKAAERLYGYTANEIVGKSIAKVIPSEKFDELLHMLKEAKNKRASETIETERLNKAGERKIVSVSYSPVFQEGEVVGVSAIARDITVQKQLEVQLKRANETLEMRVKNRTKQLESLNHTLERSNRELQDFAYVASHDLQEPLRKIQSFGNLLKEDCETLLNEECKGYLERMLNASGRMRQLINDLLLFSRVTTKALPFQPVNLSLIAQEVISDLEIRINEKRAKVELKPLPTIQADPLQMRQLFQNLLSNSLKFHRPNISPEIKVNANITDAHVQLVFHDNGIGMDEKYADKVFALFERLHSRQDYEGTGIGLAIVRKIVERHHGDITFKSREGEGTAFLITLPINQHQGEVRNE